VVLGCDHKTQSLLWDSLELVVSRGRKDRPPGGGFRGGSRLKPQEHPQRVGQVPHILTLDIGEGH